MIRSLWFQVTLLLSCVSGLSANQQHYEKLLAEHGILPNVESLSDYFRSLHPDGEGRRRVEQLIRQLGPKGRFRESRIAAA